MEKCLRVIRNAATPAGQNSATMGDIFLTNDDLAVIPYSLFKTDSSGIGKFTLGGLLMGGVGGALIGGFLDQLKPSFKESEVVTVDEAEETSKLNRKNDYGLAVADRLEKHQGFLIDKSNVRSVRFNNGACWIDTSIPEADKFMFVGRDETHTHRICTTISYWKDGQLIEVNDSHEGSNVGVCIKDVFTAFKSGEKPILTAEQVSRMTANSEYVERFATKLFDGTSRRARTDIIEWLRTDAIELFDVVIVPVQQSMPRERRSLIFWSFLLFLFILGMYFGKYINEWISLILGLAFLPSSVMTGLKLLKVTSLSKRQK